MSHNGHGELAPDSSTQAPITSIPVILVTIERAMQSDPSTPTLGVNWQVSALFQVWKMRSQFGVRGTAALLLSVLLQTLSQVSFLCISRLCTWLSSRALRLLGWSTLVAHERASSKSRFNQTHE